MMKKMIKAAAALSAAAAAMLISSVTASALSYEAEKTPDGKSYQLTSVYFDYEDNGLTTLKLPTKVDGHTVTKVGKNLFGNSWWYPDNLSKIEVPEGYTEIGDQAFQNLPIKEAVLPSTLTAVEKSAFYNCSQLETVKLGGNETTIGASAFADCYSLKDIALGPKLTKLGTKAFYYCSALKNVDLGQSLKTIGSECFAFSGLTSVVIPQNVTSLGSCAFQCCSDLEKAYFFCRTAIPDYCFRNCSVLSEVGLGNVKTINKEAFADCWSISSMNIPSTVTTIGTDAFNGCYATVSAPKGSSAETYCKKNGVRYRNKTFRNISSCTVTVSFPDMTFTGSPKTAAVTVKYGTKLLKEGTDYKVFYSQNTKVGKCAVNITGLGTYAGASTKTADIKPLDLTSSKVKVTIPCASYMYRGRGIKPTVTVKYDGKKVDSSAYTAAFANNIYPGTADITVSGKGGLTTGTYKRHFTVTKLDLTDSNVKVTIPHASYMYRAREIKPTVTVRLGSAVIPASDYGFSFSNNTEPGTAYIKVKAKSKYVTGTRSRTFTVTKLDVSEATASIPYASYTYTGSVIKPAVTLKVGSAVIPAEHYTVSYSNNKQVGTAVITVVAKGTKAEGILTRTFRIKPGKVKPAKIAAKGTKATISWKKADQADGYEIWYMDSRQDCNCCSYDKQYWAAKTVYTPTTVFKTVTSASTLSYTFTVNDSNRYSCFGVRSYKTVKGEKCCGDFVYLDTPDSLAAMINGASKSSRHTSYKIVNTQGSKDTTQTVALSAKSISAIEAFAKKNFTSDMSDGEKVKKMLYYIRSSFNYANDYYALSRNTNYVSGAYANNALVAHTGQCNDYNGAICELLNYLGYDARQIIGYHNRKGNQHLWTEVTLNGKDYIIEGGITSYAQKDANGKVLYYQDMVDFPDDLTTYEADPGFIRVSHGD